MVEQIEAILFDMGGTLRSTVKSSPLEKEAAIARIIALLGADVALDEFTILLMDRAAAYKSWAERTCIELNEIDLWTQWMLPDWPVEQISPLAIQLNQTYRDALGTRVLFPETKEVVLEMFRRGYRLGLVSNTTSSVEVPDALRELELTGCFEVVILSAVIGKRKPDPAILLDAVERMGIAPEKCVYIGDSPARDVAAARKAGFSRTVIIRDPAEQIAHPVTDVDLTPDHWVGNLKAVLGLFPAREPFQPPVRYNVSLSTMWAMNNFTSLADFFEVARRSGYGRIELNHRVDSDMLAGIDMSRYSFSTIHEPCPADISSVTLVKRDWLVSSLDEDCRQAGVKAIQRSIDLAHELGVSTIVVHAGHARMDADLEKQLRKVCKAGQSASAEARRLFEQMVCARREYAAAGLESVKKSVLELLAYAAPLGIRLGLENRFHYREFPNPDELEELLALAGPDQLGFVYDVGHAQHLSRLGFYPYIEWLQRFASRIFVTHLHDMRGLDDHFAAGLGDVDFDEIAAYLPDNAIRTCEFLERNSPEQVKSALNYLVEHGCITTL